MEREPYVGKSWFKETKYPPLMRGTADPVLSFVEHFFQIEIVSSVLYFKKK